MLAKKSYEKKSSLSTVSYNFFRYFNMKVQEINKRVGRIWIRIYSGRTNYSAFVSKLNKLSEEYLSPQKTQKAAVFLIPKILGGRMI